MKPERCKPEDLVVGLAKSHDADDRLRMLKTIKNSVIGNRRQKQSYVKLGAVQVMLDILSTEQDPSVLVQAAQAVGSFSTSEEGARAVADNGGVPMLLRILNSNDGRVVEAALRALKLLYKSGCAPIDAVFQTEGALVKLVGMLSSSESPNLQECAAAVLAHSCTSPMVPHSQAYSAHQAALVASGAVPPLVSLLSSSHRALQIAALETLASVCSGNGAAAAAVLATGPAVLSTLLSFAKHAQQPHTRFIACACLAHISPHIGRQPVSGITASVNVVPSGDDIDHAVLPVLVRLLSEPSVGCDAAPALIALAEGRPQLQRAAADADAVPRLAALLGSGNGGHGISVMPGAVPPQTARGQAGALMALGMLCADQEDHRRQLVDSGALPLVIEALSDHSPAVRGAACCCIRSLSRSSRLLRSALGAHGDVAGPLLNLSRDENLVVATEATAALANMAIEFSSLKEQLVRLGGVERFAALACSGQGILRLHGVWGLSSVAYLSMPETKISIMRHLPWATAAALLEDSDKAIREKTLLLLRNLVYNTTIEVQATLAWSNNQLLSAILLATQRPEEDARLLQHALYAVVNVSSGNSSNKDAVVDAGWPDALIPALSHENNGIREAAAWVVINLSWREGSGRGLADKSAGEARLAVLRHLGIPEILEGLKDDPCIAVRERAVNALSYFRTAQNVQGRDGGYIVEGHIPVDSADDEDNEDVIEEEEEEEEDDDDYDTPFF